MVQTTQFTMLLAQLKIKLVRQEKAVKLTVDQIDEIEQWLEAKRKN